MDPKSCCKGVKRIQCMKCGHYFDFCPASACRDSVCPNCQEYFINYIIGRERRLIQQVPWWYGKPIPGILYVEWKGGDSAAIPEFYLDVFIHLERGERDNEVNREDAVKYFEKRVFDDFKHKLIIISNGDWEEKRKNAGENQMFDPARFC